MFPNPDAIALTGVIPVPELIAAQSNQLTGTVTMNYTTRRDVTTTKPLKWKTS